jgi:hypothetical protein
MRKSLKQARKISQSGANGKREWKMEKGTKKANGKKTRIYIYEGDNCLAS